MTEFGCPVVILSSSQDVKINLLTNSFATFSVYVISFGCLGSFSVCVSFCLSLSLSLSVCLCLSLFPFCVGPLAFTINIVSVLVSVCLSAGLPASLSFCLSLSLFLFPSPSVFHVYTCIQPVFVADDFVTVQKLFRITCWEQKLTVLRKHRLHQYVRLWFSLSLCLSIYIYALTLLFSLSVYLSLYIDRYITECFWRNGLRFGMAYKVLLIGR